MRWRQYVDSQYGNPRGVMGWVIGERMIRQHRPETHWTLAVLGLRDGDAVLELGCGAGQALTMAAERVGRGHVIGLDRSGTLAKVARRRNQRQIRAGRISVLKGMVASIPLPNESVDKVFSVHSLYFWSEWDGTMQEIARVLRPGGRALFTVSDGTTDTPNAFVRDLLEHQVLPALREAGFQEIHSIRGPNSRDFATLGLCAQKACASNRIRSRHHAASGIHREGNPSQGAIGGECRRQSPASVDFTCLWGVYTRRHRG